MFCGNVSVAKISQAIMNIKRAKITKWNQKTKILPNHYLHWLRRQNHSLGSDYTKYIACGKWENGHGWLLCFHMPRFNTITNV